MYISFSFLSWQNDHLWHNLSVGRRHLDLCVPPSTQTRSVDYEIQTSKPISKAMKATPRTMTLGSRLTPGSTLQCRCPYFIAGLQSPACTLFIAANTRTGIAGAFGSTKYRVVLSENHVIGCGCCVTHRAGNVRLRCR